MTSILRGMGKLSPEQRPVVGQMVNTTRKELETAIAAKQEELKAAELANRLATEKIDVTLPGRRQSLGHLHPLTVTLNNIKISSLAWVILSLKVLKLNLIISTLKL